MRIDKLDIVCRAICAFGDLDVHVENITQLPDEARRGRRASRTALAKFPDLG